MFCIVSVNRHWAWGASYPTLPLFKTSWEENITNQIQPTTVTNVYLWRIMNFIRPVLPCDVTRGVRSQPCRNKTEQPLNNFPGHLTFSLIFHMLSLTGKLVNFFSRTCNYCNYMLPYERKFFSFKITRNYSYQINVMNWITTTTTTTEP